MSMNETLDKGLDGAFKECVHHLDSITRDNVGIGGLALEFNFDDNHTYTCTRKLTKPLYVESRDFTIEDFSVIFEVTGKISSTKTVHHSQHGAVDSYTFWVESQPTRLSRALWNRIPEALQAIATRAEFPFDISQVYEKDQSTGKVSLKVKWASNEPSCLFNVRFNVRVTVLTTIQIAFDPAVSQWRENTCLYERGPWALGTTVRCARAGVA